MTLRVLLALTIATLAACGAEVGSGDDDGHLALPGDAQVDDASPQPDGAPGYPPSPANLHWIGGACSATNACQVDDGLCLAEGFPNGMCSRECTTTCPDRGQPGDIVTFCTDGKPYGFDQGLCVSRCAPGVLPNDGCAAGYHCVPSNRFAAPATVQSICVPIVAAASACASGHDEIIDVKYPDEGALWIPKEAQCGGTFPVVVMMHGLNGSSTPGIYLGEHWHLEYEVRALIDAGLMKPVILAEPVHYAATSGVKYNAEYSPTVHLDLLAPHLAERGIAIESLSYIGHSGAGCTDGNGLYRVLDHYSELIPAYAPRMALWGAEDICYAGAYHWSEPATVLANTGTAIINLFTVQGDPTEFETGLIPPAHRTALACPSALYKSGSCIARDDKPWCSYRSQTANGITHENTPYFFVREALPQVFSPDPAVQPCR